MAYSIRNDLSVVQNDAALFSFQVFLAGKPVVLSPYTLTVLLETAQASGSVLGTFTTSSGLTLVDSGNLGQFTWGVSSTYTATVGNYWWHGYLTDTNSNQLTFSLGVFNVYGS